MLLPRGLLIAACLLAAATYVRSLKVADTSGQLVVMGVYSSPTEEAKNRRTEIRKTYWQHRLLRVGGPIVAKFVVGWTNRTDDSALAFNEEKRKMPDDFLVLDVQEAYSNLTLKTFQFLRWFATHSNAAYLLKMDDDTYPHLNTIQTYLKQQTEEYLQLGLRLPCAPVLKFTKWAENPKIWNHSFFPKYMQGSGYFLSAPLVKNIAVERYDANKKRMMNNEDAAVGLWIEMARWDDLNIEIEQREIPATLSGCWNSDLLSMNNQVGYIYRYWGREANGSDDVCNEKNRVPKASLLQMHSRARANARAAARLGLRCYSE